jgi:predicted RNA-binding protein Jag
MGGAPTKVGNVQGLDQLFQAAQAILKQTGPVRKELLGQTLEALKTGGVGAQIPIIQRAVENSKAATGNALKATTDSAAAAGVGGSYLQNILAATRIKGQQNTSQIPTEIASNFISAAPGLVTSMQGQGLGALTNTANIDLNAAEFNVSRFEDFMRDLKSSLQMAGGAAAGGGGGFGGAGGSGYTGSSAANAYTAGQATMVDN